jgi:hypothetical protein
MREEFFAGLEDRKYLPLPEVQRKGLQVCALNQQNNWAARCAPPFPSALVSPIAACRLAPPPRPVHRCLLCQRRRC